jgi:hypothetical protein
MSYHVISCHFMSFHVVSCHSCHTVCQLSFDFSGNSVKWGRVGRVSQEGSNMSSYKKQKLSIVRSVDVLDTST